MAESIWAFRDWDYQCTCTHFLSAFRNFQFLFSFWYLQSRVEMLWEQPDVDYFGLCASFGPEKIRQTNDKWKKQTPPNSQKSIGSLSPKTVGLCFKFPSWSTAVCNPAAVFSPEFTPYLCRHIVGCFAPHWGNIYVVKSKPRKWWAAHLTLQSLKFPSSYMSLCMYGKCGCINTLNCLKKRVI